MEWLLGVFFQGFAAVVFVMAAWLIASGVRRFIPDGPIKSALYDASLQRNHRWKFLVGFAVVFYGVVCLVVSRAHW